MKRRAAIASRCNGSFAVYCEKASESNFAIAGYMKAGFMDIRFYGRESLRGDG